MGARRGRHRGQAAAIVAEPDLASYHVIELSSSAGKDSLAMKIRVARMLRALGLMDRAVVVHADLGRIEWTGTPELVQAQAAHLGFQRVVMVKRSQGDLLQHVEAYGKFPTPSTRYCTADHKRAQIYRAFTALGAEVRARRALTVADGLDSKGPVRILNCIGLRSQESPGRAKRPALSRDPKPSGRNKIVDVWLPIQHLDEAEVWAECAASGAPIHPAYAAGFPRASCRFCIYMPYEALLLAGIMFPELLGEYVAVEKKIGHDFKHRLPLAKVQADIAAGVRPQGTITSWCM
jgi:3'-phosphoadenosine 5'-phosphosulfate sulfotransferase (PAPS reductase)/FAD synthetase